jgi:hypothetical protein
MNGFNPDKCAEQLVPAITMFDGLDGIIFPLRMWLLLPDVVTIVDEVDAQLK